MVFLRSSKLGAVLWYDIALANMNEFEEHIDRLAGLVASATNDVNSRYSERQALMAAYSYP